MFLPLRLRRVLRPPSTTEEGGEETTDKERSGQSSPHS
jgi:hypothetical protein